MLWLLMVACQKSEPAREPRCLPEECLDEYLFSEVAHDNIMAFGYMLRYPWSLVTERQKDRLIELATPPASHHAVESIARIPSPTDPVFLDRLIRTGLDPDKGDIPSICAGTPIHREFEDRNPYCLAVVYQLGPCRNSDEPVCAPYRDLGTDWIDRTLDPVP